MAHLDTEAVEAGPTDPLDDIAKFIGEDEGQDAPEGEEPEEGDEGLDPEANEDGEEEEGEEPEQPAIEPPVSLNAKAKEAFLNAPPEVQEAWAEAETLRNKQVQEATTRAAQREANAKTIASEQAKAELASERMEWFAQFQPSPPDPNLAYSDPMTYNALNAQYDVQMRHFNAQMEQLNSIRDTASQQADVAFIQQRDAELMAIPEVANEETRASFFEAVNAIAEHLGIPGDHLRNNADANDIRILRSVADYKAKADKWDALQAKKMESVRAAKTLPKVARPGTAPTRDMSKAAKADNAWQRVKKTRSGDDMAAYLEAQGISL